MYQIEHPEKVVRLVGRASGGTILERKIYTLAVTPQNPELSNYAFWRDL